MNANKRLPIALFFLRITVFLVMFMWTLDKFIRPTHAAIIYRTFYHVTGLGHLAMYGIGTIELIIIIGFLIGIFKRYTYGLVFIFHAVSTLSTYKQYLVPFANVNLLFFAAWPMLAACFALYLLRDEDTLLAVSKK